MAFLHVPVESVGQEHRENLHKSLGYFVHPLEVLRKVLRKVLENQLATH